MIVKYFQYFQFFSLVMAIINYRWLRACSLGIMLPLLLLVCGVETLAANHHLVHPTSNIPVYNVYFAVSPALYFILFQRMLRFRGGRYRLYLSVCIATLLFVVYDWFYIEPGRFNVYTAVLNMIWQTVLSIMVLAKLVTDESKQLPLTRDPYFWIAGNILWFTLLSIVIIGLYPYLSKSGIKLFGKAVYASVMPVANVFFYSVFAYAIYLCRKHRTTYSLS